MYGKDATTCPTKKNEKTLKQNWPGDTMYSETKQ